jgi:hypothetical protein
VSMIIVTFFLACLTMFPFPFFSESSIYALDGVLGTSGVDTQRRARTKVEYERPKILVLF